MICFTLLDFPNILVVISLKKKRNKKQQAFVIFIIFCKLSFGNFELFRRIPNPQKYSKPQNTNFPSLWILLNFQFNVDTMEEIINRQQRWSILEIITHSDSPTCISSRQLISPCKSLSHPQNTSRTSSNKLILRSEQPEPQSTEGHIKEDILSFYLCSWNDGFLIEKDGLISLCLLNYCTADWVSDATVCSNFTDVFKVFEKITENYRT